MLRPLEGGDPVVTGSLEPPFFQISLTIVNLRLVHPQITRSLMRNRWLLDAMSILSTPEQNYHYVCIPANPINCANKARGKTQDFKILITPVCSHVRCDATNWKCQKNLTWFLDLPLCWHTWLSACSNRCPHFLLPRCSLYHFLPVSICESFSSLFGRIVYSCCSLLGHGVPGLISRHRYLTLDVMIDLISEKHSIYMS